MRAPEKLPLAQLQLSGWTANSLNAAGIYTLGDLAGWSTAELLGLPGFGQRSLQVVRAVMSDFGLSLARNLKTTPPARGERRPRQETSPQRERRLRNERIQALFDQGMHPAQIARQMDMTRTNVYNILKVRRKAGKP